jgi:NTE family protein
MAEPPPAPVGLVLAGGGARGAYEIGALAELLGAVPDPHPRALPVDEHPRIIVGTSVGALNAAYLAATAAWPHTKRLRAAADLWRSIHYDDVLSHFLSLSTAGGALAYLRELLGDTHARLFALLHPGPLAETVRRLIPWDELEGVIPAALDVAAVVGTSAATERSVVFHQGGASPERDVRRGIEYVAVERLKPEHVMASAAIPVLFPAVEVHGPGAGWYVDGGTRLNTPIKPVLQLGAKRMIVIALNSLGRRGGGLSPDRPDVFDGAGQLIQALLVDPLVNDVHTLASVNEMLRGLGAEAEERSGRGRVPYILVAPEDPDEIGACAAAVFRKHRDELPGDLETLGRLLDAGAGPMHGELFSYLFFAPQMAEELLRLGGRDARRWLDSAHDDGTWHLSPL